MSARAAPVSLRRILVALDASDHANRALSEAARLAACAGGAVTGIHVYAAGLHDGRFRQMEGGLPAKYQKEDELERQRAVHDNLITRGLALISDSYHDAAAARCAERGVPFLRLSAEGRNYSRILAAATSGEFDVLALGAQGLGAVPGSSVGTVCERVVRRCPIDVLVIRDPGQALGDGPLVVGVDGSARAFGALMTAFDLGARLGVPIHAVAAFDPYFHSVAFRKISGVLSEEAGMLFRFREQEKLHEEIIDEGLAKIYRSHLEVARALAMKAGAKLGCELLEGKPYSAIARYLEKVGAGLLLVGRTGIHADAQLDIGGNAENLLRMARCHVWLSEATFVPPPELAADSTMRWSEESENKMERVPEAVRQMVRIAIVRYAQERGHTVVTSSLIEEATQKLCPHFGGSAGRDSTFESAQVTPRHGMPSLASDSGSGLSWDAAALARLAQVPEGARAGLRARVEASARQQELTEINRELLERALMRSADAAIERRE